MKFLSEKGQTSTEYLLLLVVAITLGISFKKKMEEFILTNPDSLVSRSLGSFQTRFQSDTSGRYRRFPISK